MVFFFWLKQDLSLSDHNIATILTSIVNGQGHLEFREVGKYNQTSDSLSFPVSAIYPQLLEGYNNRVFRIGSIHVSFKFKTVIFNT